MNFNCSQIQDELLAFYHRELSPIARLKIQWHLSHCPDCRKELKIMEQISTTLPGSETKESTLDAGLRAKILSQVPDAPKYQKSSSSSRSVSWVSWAAAGAAVCILAVIFFPTFGRPRENARRATSQSKLRQLELERLSRLQRAEPSPSAPMAGNANSIEAQNRVLENSSFATADGHVKWQKERKVTSALRGTLPADSKAELTPYRRVHKGGSLAVDVDELEAASDATESIVKKAGGFVAQSTLGTQKIGTKSAALEIRVPVKEFDATIKEISALGEVTAKRVQAEDVTAQVSDANEENNVVANDLRVKLDQYQKAKERAARKNKSVPDDWQQRAEIRQMRIQLAQVRSRIEYLKKLSDFAALSVELREQSGGVSGGGFLNDIGNTGRAAWDSFLVAARLPINLLIYILVYSPFWLPILVVWRYFMRPQTNRVSGP
jgi:hypothetical protein